MSAALASATRLQRLSASRRVALSFSVRRSSLDDVAASFERDARELFYR